MPLTMKDMVEECMEHVREAAKRHRIEVHMLERWPIAAMNAFTEACEKLDELRDSLESAGQP